MAQIHPEVVRRLNEHPDFRMLQKYLAEAALELNNLSDIALTDPTEIATEVLARKRAHAKVVEIIGDLLPEGGVVAGPSASSEYAVDVEDEK